MPVQIMPRQPSGPEQLIQAFMQQYQAGQQQRLEQQQLQKETALKERELALKEKQADSPINKLLDVSKVAKAFLDMGMSQEAIKSIFGMGAGAQLGVIPSTQQISAPSIRGTLQQPTEELQFRPEEAEMTPFGGLKPTKFKRVPTEAEKLGEQKIKAKAEVLKLGEKGRANFGRAIGMFSTLISQAKGMGEDQKKVLQQAGIESTGLGLLPGIAGKYGVMTKRPWASRVAAFRGQRRETALSLNSILTGQNRVIRSVVEMIFETLPDPYDPDEMMASKVAQSVTNSYKLVKSFEKAGLSSERLNQMSPEELGNIDAGSLIRMYALTSEEQKEIGRVINDVLKTKVAPKRELLKPGKQGVKDKRTEYNRLREQGYPSEVARQMLGL